MGVHTPTYNFATFIICQVFCSRAGEGNGLKNHGKIAYVISIYALASIGIFFIEYLHYVVLIMIFFNQMIKALDQGHQASANGLVFSESS